MKKKASILLLSLIGLFAWAQPKSTAENGIRALADSFFTSNSKTLTTLLAPEFVYRFLGTMPLNKARYVKRLETAPPPRFEQREWLYQELSQADHSCVVAGELRETRLSSKGDTVRADYYYMFVFTKAGQAWQLLQVMCTLGGSALMEQTWNRLLADPEGFRQDPNQFIVEQSQKLQPTNALDIASGQGRNSIHLLKAGWAVTAVDIAGEGLRMTTEQARHLGKSITTMKSSIDTYDFGKNKWGLIVMCYYTPVSKYLKQIHEALVPGGIFLFEGFPNQVIRLPGGVETTAAQILGFRDEIHKWGFDILHYEDTMALADWGGPKPTRVVRIAIKKKK